MAVYKFVKYTIYISRIMHRVNIMSKIRNCQHRKELDYFAGNYRDLRLIKKWIRTRYC